MEIDAWPAAKPTDRMSDLNAQTQHERHSPASGRNHMSLTLTQVIEAAERAYALADVGGAMTADTLVCRFYAKLIAVRDAQQACLALVGGSLVSFRTGPILS